MINLVSSRDLLNGRCGGDEIWNRVGVGVFFTSFQSLLLLKLQQWGNLISTASIEKGIGLKRRIVFFGI